MRTACIWTLFANLYLLLYIKPILNPSVRQQFHYFDQPPKHTQSGLWDIIMGEGLIYTAFKN